MKQWIMYILIFLAGVYLAPQVKGVFGKSGG